MQLPFLKNKRWPRIETPFLEEKTYGQSPSDKLEELCIDELFEACEEKNVSAFRESVEALILNCFDDGEYPDAA